jgi:glyoxylase-like metal-dependent hydrolase (beta-lactamase superfamily II)
VGTTTDQPIHTDALPAREPAADVGRLYVAFVNVYFAGARGGPWALVDTAVPNTAALVRRRAAERYGAASRPTAIVLTHGHFDHAGNALELARGWDVPVYAHPLELPDLTGRSRYPPQDPTVGGALGLMSRAFPVTGTDLGDRVRPLPDDGTVPGMPGWRWVHTPGHTAGHVSLFRDADRFLIAGDACATVDQDSPLAMFNLRAEFSVPPAPLTTDWGAARASVEQLAALAPSTVAAGHGRPVHGPEVAADLRRFAEHFTPPRGGRYSDQPATADASGVVSVPPPVPDPLPRQLLVAGLVAGGAYLASRRRRDR